MMRSEDTAIILGKLALLEYRDLKTAMNQEKVFAKIWTQRRTIFKTS